MFLRRTIGLSLLVFAGVFSQWAPQALGAAPPQVPETRGLLLLSDAAHLPLARQWGEGVRLENPRLTVEVRDVEDAGTLPWWKVKGPPAAVLQGEAMTKSQIAEFQEQFGYPPREFPVVLNAATIVVHRDNLIARQGLTLAQLDAVFSSTRLRGHPPVRTWGDLGLSGDHAKLPIVAYGQNATGNLHEFFRKEVLAGGDFAPRVARLESSAGIVRAVADDPAGIGFVGLPFAELGVAKVPVAAPGGSAVPATLQSMAEGRYPLVQTLRLYLNLRPGQTLDGALKTLLQYIYGNQGQEVAVDHGYAPLPDKLRVELP